MTRHNRPKKEKRLFNSVVVEESIKEISSYIRNEDLSRLFINCFPNTLDTTVHYGEDEKGPDTYVVTGDIPAMWLRDSVAQVWPYLGFVKDDLELKKLFQGLIRKHVDCILHDSYANAFKCGRNGKIEVFERKWELDSLCYFIRLSYFFWKESGDKSIFNGRWRKAVSKIMKTFDDQSNKELMDRYKYRTPDNCPEILNLVGFGNPLPGKSMIRSAFRPSDDATIFQYLIPSNCFAVVSLKQLAEIHEKALKNSLKSEIFKKRAVKIDKEIKKIGVVKNKKGMRVFAYEVDGYGGQAIMDDANIPSLLSLPYLGYIKPDSRIYKNTRKTILSRENPYYFEADNCSGIGSSHTSYGNIWPMSIIMQALTSNNKREIKKCLDILRSTHAGKYFMHESFRKNNPARYTRRWFGWANSLFGELILKLYNTDKKILNK